MIYVERQDFVYREKARYDSLIKKIFYSYYLNNLQLQTSSLWGSAFILFSMIQLTCFILVNQKAFMVSTNYPILLQSFMDVFLISPFLFEWTFIYYILLGLLCFLSIVLLFLGIFVKVELYLQKIINSIFSIFGRIYFWILCMPMTDIFLKSFSCNEGNFYIDPKFNCFSGSHIIIIIVSIVNLVLLGIISFVQSLLQNNFSFFSKDKFSRLITTIELWILLLKILVIFLNQYYVFNYYTLVIVLLLGIIICYKGFFGSYIFDKRISYIFNGCNLFFVWAILCLIIFNIFFDYEIYISGQYAFIVAGLIIIIICSKLIYEIQIRKVLRKFKIERDQEEFSFLLKASIINQVLVEGKKAQLDILQGTIIDHQYRCFDTNCFCKNTNSITLPLDGTQVDLSKCELNDEIRIKFLLLEYYNLNCSQPHRSPKSLIYYSVYLQYVIGNFPKAYFKVSEIEGASFIENFVIFCCKENIEENYNTRMNRFNSKKISEFVDITKLIRLEYANQELEKSIVESCENFKFLWEQFNLPIPDFNKARTISHKVMYHINDSKKIWKKLNSISKIYIPSIKIYSKFLILINKKQQLIDNTELGSFEMSENLFTGKSIVDPEGFSMLFSLNNSESGEIKRVTKSCLAMTGYVKKDLEGHNVKAILKYQFEEVLNNYLTKFQLKKLNSSQIFFVKRKDGYIQPMECKINYIINIVNGIQVMLFMKRPNTKSDEYILASENNRVLSMTEDIATTLQITSNQIENIIIKFKYICPNLLELTSSEEIVKCELNIMDKAIHNLENYQPQFIKFSENPDSKAENELDLKIIEEIKGLNDLKNFSINTHISKQNSETSNSFFIIKVIDFKKPGNRKIHSTSKLSAEEDRFELSKEIVNEDLMKANNVKLCIQDFISRHHEYSASVKRIKKRHKSMIYLRELKNASTYLNENVIVKKITDEFRESQQEETKNDVAKGNTLKQEKDKDIEDEDINEEDEKKRILKDKKGKNKNNSNEEEETPEASDDELKKKNLSIKSFNISFISKIKLIEYLLVLILLGLILTLFFTELSMINSNSNLKTLINRVPRRIGFIPIIIDLSTKQLQLLPNNSGVSFLLDKSYLDSTFDFSKIYLASKDAIDFESWISSTIKDYTFSLIEYQAIISSSINMVKHGKRKIFDPINVTAQYDGFPQISDVSALLLLNKFSYYTFKFLEQDLSNNIKLTSIKFLIENGMNSSFMTLFQIFNTYLDFFRDLINQFFMQFYIEIALILLVAFGFLFLVIPTSRYSTKLENSLFEIYCSLGKKYFNDMINENSKIITLIKQNLKELQIVSEKSGSNSSLDNSKTSEEISKLNLDDVEEEENFIKINPKMLVNVILIICIIIIFGCLITYEYFTIRSFLSSILAYDEELYSVCQLYTLLNTYYCSVDIMITFNSTYQILGMKDEDALQWISKEFNLTFYRTHDVKNNYDAFLLDKFINDKKLVYNQDCCEIFTDLINCSTLYYGIGKKGINEVLLYYMNSVYQFASKYIKTDKDKRTSDFIISILNDKDYIQMMVLERNLIRRWQRFFITRIEEDLNSIKNKIVIVLILKYIFYFLFVLVTISIFLKIKINSLQNSLILVIKLFRYMKNVKDDSFNECQKKMNKFYKKVGLLD